MKFKFMHTVIAAVLLVTISLLIVDVSNPGYGFFAKVESGNVGIISRFGKVKEETLQPGFHVTSWFEHVYPVNVRTQKGSYQMESFSADIQQVGVSVAINYNVSPDSAYVLFTTVGMDYKGTLLEPRLLENVKVVVSNYTAEELVSHRETLSSQILDRMKTSLDGYGIVVTNVSIENLDFTDSFEAAVEAKQVATQEKQRAKTEQEQRTMEKEEQAKRDVIAAEAALAVKKIEAEAVEYAGQKEAAANKAVAESLTPELIEYFKIQKWNGELPAVMSGETMPILNVNDLTRESGE